MYLRKNRNSVEFPASTKNSLCALAHTQTPFCVEPNTQCTQAFTTILFFDCWQYAKMEILSYFCILRKSDQNWNQGKSGVKANVWAHFTECITRVNIVLSKQHKDYCWNGFGAYDHTTLNTPVLVCSLKVSSVGHAQYLDGWPPGNSRCCRHFFFLPFRFFISSHARLLLPFFYIPLSYVFPCTFTFFRLYFFSIFIPRKL